MARMTPEEMDKLTKSHGIAELARDVEATMEAVGPNPRWEYHPAELACVDHEAVRAVYQIFFDTVWPFSSMTTVSRVHGDNCIWIELVVRFDFDGYEEGREIDSHVASKFTFEDGYIIGELGYYGGPLATITDRILDNQSFRALPGVVDLRARS